MLLLGRIEERENGPRLGIAVTFVLLVTVPIDYLLQVYVLNLIALSKVWI